MNFLSYWFYLDSNWLPLRPTVSQKSWRTEKTSQCCSCLFSQDWKVQSGKSFWRSDLYPGNILYIKLYLWTWWLSAFLTFCLCVFLLFCHSFFVSFCCSVFLSFCISVFLSFCLSVFLSFCLLVFKSVLSEDFTRTLSLC